MNGRNLLAALVVFGLAFLSWEWNALAGVNSVTINSVTPSASWFKGTDLPTVVSVTYSWAGTNITGAALSIGAPPPPLGSPIAVQNISFTADTGTRTDKVPLPVGLPDGKLTLYVVILSSTTPANSLAQQTQAVWVDKTAPTITVTRSPEPNSAGWNNSDVTLGFVCSDGADGAQSGIANCPDPITVSGEGANQSIVVASTDQAGNKRIFTVDGINIDKTPPRLKINKPESGTIYAISQKIVADWTAIDDWSGIANINASAAKGSLIDTNTLGIREFHLNATDGAGNSASLTVPYKVSYNFAFQSPLKANRMNAVSLNKTFQIRFQILDGQRKPLKNVIATLWYRAADAKGKPIDENYQQAPPKAPFEGETFLYSGNSAFYFYNSDTQAIGAGRWQFAVRLDDGTTRTLDVLIKGIGPRRPSGEKLATRLLSLALDEKSARSFTVEVFDVYGRLVLHQETDNSWTPSDLSEENRLVNGVYFYTVTERDRDGKIIQRELKKTVLMR
ncbi:hypothetical protein HYR54_06485 [Candidatus Acetothermia bacterium]|nr:hypothetical protein [Candidatus Acetothermia bacterium]